MSLRFRLNLMITLTMLVILGVGTLFVIYNARRAVFMEVQSSVNLALQLIDSGLAHIGSDEEALRDWLAELAQLEKTRHLHLHVQQPPDDLVVSENGRAAAHGGDAQGGARQPLIPLDLNSSRQTDNPVPQWFAWSVMPELMEVEKRVDLAGGKSIRILVEANPDDEIVEAWAEAEGFLYLELSLALAMYGLVYFTLGRAFRAVGIILQGLEGIERGHYHDRLPPLSLPEFDRISQAFNHTVQALAKAHEENRALIQQSLMIQEEERRYLAQELHDEMGQSVTAIKVMAVALRKSVNGGEAVETIIKTCDRLFDVVRGMMRKLRPMLLDEFGLVLSLQDLIDNWRDRNPGISIQFCYETGVETVCADSAKIHLFRIVQECLTNVVKHAGAKHVIIHLSLIERHHNAWVTLTVQDDGQGFDSNQPPVGFGLLGMKERTASLGGDFFLITSPGQGVKIEVKVPGKEERS